MASNPPQNGFPVGWSDLWSRVGTKGDIATVLLAAPVGFVADIAWSMAGIVSPATCAVLAASTALGLKSWVQAGKPNASDKSREAAGAPVPDATSPLMSRCRTLIANLQSLSHGLDFDDLDARERLTQEVEALKVELELFASGLSTDAVLQSALDQGVTFYREAKGLPTNPLHRVA